MARTTQRPPTSQFALYMLCCTRLWPISQATCGKARPPLLQVAAFSFGAAREVCLMKERDNQALSVRQSVYLLIGLVIITGIVAYSAPLIAPFLR